jgi:hypothetical protein
MCFGSQPKVKMPKAPELPKPMVAPAPPPPAAAPPKPLQQQGARPDIRIGTQKSSTTQRNRTSGQGMKSSLSIGSNKGLNL